MKLITVLVNNRIDHIVDFEPRKKSPNSYIVQNTGGDVNLFMFYRESEKQLRQQLIYQTKDGKMHAALAGISMSEVTSGSSGSQMCELSINVCLEVEETGDFYRKGNKYVAEDIQYPANWTEECDKSVWDDKNLKVKLHTANDKVYKVQVNFIVHEGDGRFSSSSFYINVVPERFIWDVVLDYGSEASQMLIFNRGTNHQVTINNITPLFPLFKSTLGVEGVDPTEYMQYDADDGENFYKSFFFASKHPDNDNPDPCVPFKNNENLKLMTPVGDLDTIRKSYLTIPNIKVASHGGVRLPKVYDSLGMPREIFSFGDNYFYRSLVNSFLYQAMRFAKRAGDPAFLNICLLMPNVYTQARITENLVNVAEDVMKMAKNEEVSHVCGVETAALSESDASFLGFMETRSPSVPVKKGRYLILDAGKGTLDFSILVYDPYADARHMYNSVFRSGIIGSGNAITYSVLLAVLNDIISHKWPEMDPDTRKKNISEFIKNKITNENADEASVCSVLDNLEQYKRKYNSKELSRKDFSVELGNINSIDDLGLDALNNILGAFNKENYLIKDESFIVNMIDELAADVAEKIRSSYSRSDSSKIDYLVFAGRGFQMTKLKNTVLERLKTVNNDICSDMKVISAGTSHTSSATYKNICLFVRGHLCSGRYNGRLVGQPQMIAHDEKAYVYEEQEEVVDTPQSVPEKSGKGANLLMNVKAKVKDLGKALIKLVPTSENQNETINFLPGSDVDDLNRALVNGFNLTVTSSADHVVFSGVSYPVPNNITPGDNAEMFFTGAEFVFRQNGEIGYLDAPTNLDSQHVYESSFPFAELTGSKNALVPFPKKKVAEVAEGKKNGDTKSEGIGSYASEDEVVLSKYNKNE